jgi:hypothetical protein
MILGTGTGDFERTQILFDRGEGNRREPPCGCNEGTQPGSVDKWPEAWEKRPEGLLGGHPLGSLEGHDVEVVEDAPDDAVEGKCGAEQQLAAQRGWGRSTADLCANRFKLGSGLILVLQNGIGEGREGGFVIENF